LFPSHDQVKDAYNQSIDDVLTKPTGIGGQIDLNETLRVGKAVGGPLDLEARRKQSYEDYLARQGGVQPAAPQAPTTTSTTTSNTGSATPTTSTTTAPQPQSTAPQPFDMSKYQGGYFGGGIEDSRNIALGDLEELGVDVSKYRTTKATDTSGPKFKGLSINEIFAMGPEEAKQKLGFDPSVQGANAEFEEFLKVNDPGPQLIGPGGPPGMKTEFKNQDELAQILNRAIPFYMRTARDLGENYTLQEMLAMSDEELAALDDRYDKKMGYGKYATTSPNIFKTGYDPDAMKQYNDVQKFMGEIKKQSKAAKGASGNTLNYSTGGRVGLESGGLLGALGRMMAPKDLDLMTIKATLNQVHTNNDDGKGGGMAAVMEFMEKNPEYKVQVMENIIGDRGNKIRVAPIEKTPINILDNYSTGGRVGFRYGGEDAKVKKYMKTDYSDPFNRLTKKDIGRHKAYNSAVLKKAKGMVPPDRDWETNSTTC